MHAEDKHFFNNFEVSSKKVHIKKGKTKVMNL